MSSKISSQKSQIIIIVLFVIILMAVESVAMHRVFSSRVQGTADFFARWYGAKELVLNGRNPYDRQIDFEAQELMFGRRTQPDEDQVNFAYPLYTIYTFFPLTLTSYAWAQAIWMVVLQFALLGGALLLFDLVKWRPPPWLFILTMFWTIFFYSGARSIMLGQFSVIVYLFLTLSLWALAKDNNWLAGLVLPLTTIKPQMVFLIIPLLLLWALREKRWQFIAGFGISMALLLITSLLWVPDWVFRFLNNLTEYSGYVGFGSPLENMTAQFTPGFDAWLNPLITLALSIFLLWQWWKVLFRQPQDLLWAANWTLLIGNLIAFRSATTNHVTLYLAMFIIFKRLAPLAKGKWTAAVQIISIVSLWIIFLTTIDKSRGDNFEAVFMHGLLPTILIVYYLVDWRKLKKVTPDF